MADIGMLMGLLERVRAAKPEDLAEINTAFWEMAEPEQSKSLLLRAPLYAASIDVAVALVERILPGCIWGVTSTGMAWVRDELFLSKAVSPPLALLTALLIDMIILARRPNGEAMG